MLADIVSKMKPQAESADAIGSTLKFAFGDGECIHIDGTGDTLSLIHI